MNYPSSIQNLINYFTKLPSVGPKTAERYVFYLLNQTQEELDLFAKAIKDLKQNIKICQKCCSVSNAKICNICSDGKRRQDIICVVANTRDMLTIENTGQYNGVYHVLGGMLNSLSDIKPENLTIRQLLLRLKKEKIKEIILALSPTIEGETTTMYLEKIISPYKIKVTRLARGLPTGSDLEYADDLTISNALKYRR